MAVFRRAHLLLTVSSLCGSRHQVAAGAELIDGESGSNRDRFTRSYFRRSGQVRTFVFRIPTRRSLKSCRGDVKPRRSLLVASDRSLWRWYERHRWAAARTELRIRSGRPRWLLRWCRIEHFHGRCDARGFTRRTFVSKSVVVLADSRGSRAANVAVGIEGRCDRPYGTSGAGHGPHGRGVREGRDPDRCRCFVWSRLLNYFADHGALTGRGGV